MPDTPHATGARAIFLSYAREDADAARRIADALRAFGVEVWFDQSELRGGDTWDQKIRRQIKECALFMPVISATTQARGEGYFRREWRLGVDRTHDMSAGTAFIVPVVIDNTPETGADVPEEFMRYQWTRLAHGVPSSQFVEQVKRLLGGERGASSREHGGQRTEVRGQKSEVRVTPRRSWLMPVIVGVVVAVGLAVFMLRKPAPVAAPVTVAAPVASEAKPAAITTDKSIAVLPFTNMSEDKDASAFFSDGIHEDILTNLALVRELRVVSRTSVMGYRNTTKSMKQIAQELGVTYILEGSVRRVGNKVRVTGQLIHAATDEHVWAQAYDRDLTDVFAIQSELSSQIAGALKAALSPEEKILIARRPTENVAAYDLYLKARDLANRAGNVRTALEKRESLLRDATELDPNFAEAWGELADVHALFVFWGFDGTDTRLAKAKAAADQAARLAPDSFAVIGSLGTYYYYGYRDYARATEQYERLSRQQPNSPTVHYSLGLILRRQGKWAESLTRIRRANQLDPGNVSIQRSLITSLLAANRWPELAVEQRRMVELNPNDLGEAYNLALIPFYVDGSTKETDAFFSRMPASLANSPRGIWQTGQWAFMKGDSAALVRLDKLQPYFDEDGSPPWFDASNGAAGLFLQNDLPGARARVKPFVEELRARLSREPRNSKVMFTLGFIEAILGNREEAVRLGLRLEELTPTAKDALDGPTNQTLAAIIFAWAGDKDRALTRLAEVIRLPGGPALMDIKYSLSLAPLRGDPRFEALVNDPKNNEPRF